MLNFIDYFNETLVRTDDWAYARVVLKKQTYYSQFCPLALAHLQHSDLPRAAFDFACA